MKLILLACALLSSSLFAADYSFYESTLQSKLAFSGEVEVTNVVSQENGEFVTMEVTSYGETRTNWCLFEGAEIVQCMDNWFYKEDNGLSDYNSEYGDYL